MPKKISKPFIVATEGATVDGRNISRDWLIQMAASYDPKVYTAVANIEHLLSLSPDGMFSAQGRVLSLSTQEATILGEKKLQLLATVEVDEAIAAMQAIGKKAFSSMEVAANFVGKGIAYLTGLAFTDTPASLGTESMKFSANQQSVYSFGGDGITIEFDDVTETTGQSLFAKVVGLLKGKDKKDEDRFADTGKAVEAVAESQRTVLDGFSAMQAEIKRLGDQAKAAETAAAEDRAAFATLKAELDKEPVTKPRPAASGGDGSAVTNC